MTTKRILSLLTALWLTISIPVNALAAGRTEDGAIAIAEETELPGETAAEGTETLPEEAAPLSQTNSGTCGDNLTWTLDEDGTLTISGTGEMNSHPWDSDSSGIKRVVIESGVTSIADIAFSYCRSLISVTIPESVTLVGKSAFYGCSSLTSAGPIGGDYGYQFGWTETIPAYAFYECDGLTSVTISESVTSIGNSAFYGCRSLTSITIPKSITSIGDSMFYGCSGLTSITIPESITSIGDSAFYGCRGLTSVTILESITSIGNNAFWGCSGLTEILVASGNSNYVSVDGVLFNRSRNVLLQFPGGKKGSYFIPESVTSIGASAFSYCSGLTSVTIPESITSIGDSAFSGCRSLTSVTIPESVTSIGDRAFSYCSGLTSVTIPESITSIGVSAFSGCSGLTSVTIPQSVTSIGMSAFYGCRSLTSVTIPQSVTLIDEFAFYECHSLTSVTIPESVTSIGSYAFQFCTKLASVTIPQSVTSLNSSVFSYCSGLTSVTIPESVTSIGWYAFENCTRLTSVIIPESVTLIDSSAFSGCSGLTNVTLPESITSIKGNVFEGCTSLTSVIIPAGVTSIQYYAFKNCNGLVAVTIPESVKSIDSYAFWGCPDLFIYCYPGSYAETYAIKNDIPYSLLSTDDDEVVTWLTSNAQSGVSAGIDFLIRTGWSTLKTASHLQLKLPAGIALSSIWLDSTELDTASYTLENGLLTIPLGALSEDRTAYTLYLYCCAAVGGSYRFSGELTMADTTTHELGAAVVEVEEVRISIPETVGASKGIVASGKTVPGLPVTLFVDGTAAGESTANDAGSWLISFDLPDTQSFHTIYAEIELKDGGTVKSEETRIIYRASEIKPVKVTMYNYPGGETVFDFTEPETLNQLRYYSYSTYYPTFTFRAEFEGHEPSVVYIITKNSEGKTTKIPTVYDARTKSWIGTHDYTFQDAPVWVNVIYDEDGFSSNKLPAVCIMDPSGYVYEAVPSNRLSGVTATISCEADGGGAWDAGRFDQTNPQLTGADGSYYWDVPAGKWKVTFTKEGYVTTDTTEIAKAAGHEDGWLPVPPPQTEINAPMVSTAPPEVKYAAVYEDRAEITFSQYMDIDSVKGAVTLNGSAANVEALDAEDNADKTARYATRFKASAEGLSGNVALSVSTDAKNYAGNGLKQAYMETFSVEIRPTGMIAPDKVSVQMNGSQKISVTLEPAVSERTLAIENLTPAIMQTPAAEVTTGAGGGAEITIEALLPGAGLLRISEPRSGLTKTVSVQVEEAAKAETSIKASITDGVLTYEVMNPPAGQTAKLFAAGYQGLRMTSVTDLTGLRGTRTLTDTAADSYSLFLVNAAAWNPLCPKTVVEMAGEG